MSLLQRRLIPLIQIGLHLSYEAALVWLVLYLLHSITGGWGRMVAMVAVTLFSLSTVYSGQTGDDSPPLNLSFLQPLRGILLLVYRTDGNLALHPFSQRMVRQRELLLWEWGADLTSYIMGSILGIPGDWSVEGVSTVKMEEIDLHQD